MSCFILPGKNGRTQTIVHKLAVRSLICVVLLNPKVTPQVGLAQCFLNRFIMMHDRLSMSGDVQLLVRKLNVQRYHLYEKNTEKYI